MVYICGHISLRFFSNQRTTFFICNEWGFGSSIATAANQESTRQGKMKGLIIGQKTQESLVTETRQRQRSRFGVVGRAFLGNGNKRS